VNPEIQSGGYMSKILEVNSSVNSPEEMREGAEILELSPTALMLVGGGDEGAGLIRMPK
jgi:hypothetical protein